MNHLLTERLCAWVRENSCRRAYPSVCKILLQLPPSICIRICLPPLRECQDDIMLLADFYLRHYNQEFRKQVKRFDASAQREMRAHSLSGNIRELKHVVRVAVLKSRGEIITPKELDFDTPSTGAHVQFKLKTGDEKNKITAAIAHADGNLTKAAYLLGISQGTLLVKRKKYGLA